jgi:hypothetical protein
MVSCAVAVLLAARLTLELENWQVTPIGSEAQASAIVSLKFPFEASVTVPVALWLAAIVKLAGVTVRLKGLSASASTIGFDVEGECSASPP